MNILVTGGTGYIGGRLIPRLLEKGHRVRVLVRDPSRIGDRPWLRDVEVVRGDLLDSETLTHVFQDIETAYYLVHSMNAGPGYRELDRRCAENFVRAGRSLQKVVYLGGLVPRGDRVSPHLSSRAEVGRILEDGLPATIFRAGPIIGSGSASFEMVRYLTERLPWMPAPRWILHEVQPVSIRDTLTYLVEAADREPAGIVEIGADRLSFKRMLEVYAEARGLRRFVFPLPVLVPALAGWWVALVTPIPVHLAVPLVQGIVSSLSADTRRARELFPDIHPMSYRAAVDLALLRIARGQVETRWSGALGGAPTYELHDWEGVMRETRTRHVDASPERVFHVFSSLGGDTGWLSWEWVWEVRGWIDRMVGGPGLRRGRRDPQDLLPGETVDFWRVETVTYYSLLRLRAEMRVPGQAWMQWEVVPEGKGTRLIQTAMFAPRGLLGTLYWASLYPIHGFIFSGLVKAIARRAEEEVRARDSGSSG